MQIDHPHETRCARLGCRCTVPDGHDYCGEYCRATTQYPARGGNGTCTCGHDGCRSDKAYRARKQYMRRPHGEHEAPRMNARLKAAFSRFFEV